MLREQRLQFEGRFIIHFGFRQSTQRPLSFIVTAYTKEKTYQFKIRRTGKRWVITSDLKPLPVYMPFLTDYIGGLIEAQIGQPKPSSAL
jgi:hypothetical protein